MALQLLRLLQRLCVVLERWAYNRRARLPERCVPFAVRAPALARRHLLAELNPAPLVDVLEESRRAPRANARAEVPDWTRPLPGEEWPPADG